MNKTLYVLDIPENYREVLRDPSITEAIETIFPHYCLYMKERDPDQLEVFIESVGDLSEGNLALEVIQVIMDNVPDNEIYFDGSSEMDYSMEIDGWTIRIEFISKPY